MKLIMREYDKRYVIPGRGYMLAVVHDEILGEVEEEHAEGLIEEIKDIFCNTVQLKNVPLDTDAKIITSWADK